MIAFRRLLWGYVLASHYWTDEVNWTQDMGGASCGLRLDHYLLRLIYIYFYPQKTRLPDQFTYGIRSRPSSSQRYSTRVIQRNPSLIYGSIASPITTNSCSQLTPILCPDRPRRHRRSDWEGVASEASSLLFYGI